MEEVIKNRQILTSVGSAANTLPAPPIVVPASISVGSGSVRSAAPLSDQGLSAFAKFMNSMSSLSRNEFIQNICKLSLFSLATILTVKWMIKQLDPTNQQKKNAAKKAQDILCKLGITNSNDFTEYELTIASHLMDPKDINISWNNIGGLTKVIQEIKETVILPIRRQDLFNSSKLSRPPKGILLHGPPGCGKTMIAKATAREAGTKFINLDLSILTDKWYGESQKLAAAVFSLAVKLQPCIIFIDEIDSFLRSRNVQDHEATAMMKAQFMTLWDGLCTNPQCTVIVMGATNRPNDLDKAILRRMPATFHIPLPDEKQRLEILKLVLDEEPTDAMVKAKLPEIAKRAEGFSGSDIKELCRNASMYRVRDYMNSSCNKESMEECKDAKLNDEEEQYHDALRQISFEDLLKSLSKMKQTKVSGAPS